MNFEQRTVMVTGGTGALGTAVVAAFIEAGAACHIPCLSADEAQAFAYRGHDAVTLHPHTDLTDETAVDRLYRGVPDLWASVHLAGGFAYGDVKSAAKAVLSGQLELNVATCYLCCRSAVVAMAATAHGGRIVNVAARPALEWRSGANMVPYTASKAAVAALTVALAEEVAPQDILVNAVAPSILDTPANRRAMPHADPTAWPKLDDVARIILFLASPENRVTRGAIVPVYGRA